MSLLFLFNALSRRKYKALTPQNFHFPKLLSSSIA